MALLTNLRSKVSPLGSRLTTMHDVRKVERTDWRGWYGTARWKALRKAVLVRDLYTCRMCGTILSGRAPEPHSPVVDHRKPHRGSPALFWDEGNLQALCKSPCHDQHKQALEVAGRI